MDVIKVLSEAVSAAFEQCGYDGALGTVTVSDRLDLCQFQCNGAFGGAKLYKKAPLVIAGEIAAVLSANAMLQSAEAAAPGFINMTLTDECLLSAVSDVAGDPNLGVPQCDNPTTIVIDYGGPNVAKPLHIGHLRSAIIGEALKRIARAANGSVISDVHLGDWGLQMGLVIAELEVRYPQWRCFSPDFDASADTVEPLDAATLNEVYPFASQKSKEDEAFKARAREITSALQCGHPGYTALWKEMMRVSVNDMKGLYKQLRVDFDYWYGESDAEKYVPELVEILNGKGLLHESDGAMVVDVEEETDKATVPPVIIKKSDNSNMYATTDLATILQRGRDFAPNEIWYVVDKRQGLHFTQVFRCAEKAGLNNGAELLHLGFGTMNGSDGKPYKTRDGGVMRLSDLLDTVVESARQKIDGSEYATAEEKDIIAQKTAIAAIKFGDLINHRTKDYIFDIDKFLSFEGKTGCYLLYTISRINSILKKANIADRDGDISLGSIYSDTERELYLAIALSSEAFRFALLEKAPNYICENAYKIASLFSAFYGKSQITGEQDVPKRSTWLNLCILVRRMLIQHLDVLGIESVESM